MSKKKPKKIKPKEEAPVQTQDVGLPPPPKDPPGGHN